MAVEHVKMEVAEEDAVRLAGEVAKSVSRTKEEFVVPR
jgi:hypothetical protein